MRSLTATLILTGVLSLFAAYLGLRFSVWSFYVGFSPVLAWILLGAFVITQAMSYYFNSRTHHHVMSPIIAWLTQILFGLFICLLIFTVAFDCTSLFASLFLSPVQQAHFEIFSFYATLSLSLIATGVGFTQARVIGPQIYEVDILLENLPTAFEGFRIGQISDLHIGPTIGHRYVQMVVEKINQLETDLVVLTGDIVDGPVTQFKKDLMPLSQMNAKHGRYIITGNHEYYWGALEWLQEYEKNGLRPLLNEHVILRQDQSELVLAGITDYFAKRIIPDHAYNVQKSLAGAPLEAIKILLSHQPAPFAEIAEAGVHLQLSGHTHGGQFFPSNLLVRLFQKFFKGLYRHENMWIYVNRGTGYWGPPLRFGVPSEITLLKLRKKI